MNKVELHRALTRVLNARIPRDCVCDLELLRNYIEDSEPVKHGRWILCDDGYVRCSECNCKAFIENDETILTDFCHGCGADVRMDGDNE